MQTRRQKDEEKISRRAQTEKNSNHPVPHTIAISPSNASTIPHEFPYITTQSSPPVLATAIAALSIADCSFGPPFS
ncbi:hypothetical protein P171DRAFT_52031 [Karstenula rhodostoma CBS 690.94]|uniref:Uncharacterized protein n=1 Tax=Karstenula rhodostoma CBS 690.94 TaxID=1392251 RepID=A0A9P4PDA0_9PLEO|nr:hypothetical protein P171DRAFT_52031 [Karstenula rhodostoma CBS 690.94]